MADNVAEIDWEDDVPPADASAYSDSDIMTRLEHIERQNEQILCYLRMICEHPLSRATPRRSHEAAAPR